MAAHDVHNQFLRKSTQEQLDRIAANFASAAVSIRQHKPEAELTPLFEETKRFCEWAASSAGSSDVTSLLSNLTTALTTWQEVWPRLGQTADFRHAVAREADLWSRRLGTMARSRPS